MKLKFTSHLANRKYGYFSYLAEIIALFAIYFSTAKLGLSLDAVSRFATLIWLPSGIAAAALLLFGYRLWPGIINRSISGKSIKWRSTLCCSRHRHRKYT